MGTMPPFFNRIECNKHVAVSGTIPDGVSCGDEGADALDGIPANIRQDVEPEIGTWDQYFDEKRDIRLEGRGGTFRSAATVLDSTWLRVLEGVRLTQNFCAAGCMWRVVRAQ